LEEYMPLAQHANGDDQHDVEEVLGRRVVEGGILYKVRFKGWPEEYDEWVPAEDLGEDHRKAYDIGVEVR
jgi:hypothetical protein